MGRGSEPGNGPPVPPSAGTATFSFEPDLAGKQAAATAMLPLPERSGEREAP
jgi:hypothetical protein